MIGIAVIGYGYWGPNLVRNFALVDGARVVAVVDQRPERRDVVEKLYPTVQTYADVADMLANPDVDAVVDRDAGDDPLRSSSMQALAAGKHVIVEKPMTSTVAEGEELVAEAAERGLTLMVDHTFIYTSAVRKIHELVSGGQLGELYYYDSVRVNLGLFQHDVSVLWDLAVHDLSIMDFLLGADADPGVGHRRRPRRGPAGEHGVSHVLLRGLDDRPLPRQLAGAGQGPPDAALRLRADGRVRRRRDEREGQGVRQGHRARRPRSVGYRATCRVPDRRHVGAASRRDRGTRVEAEHFVECINTGSTPQSDGAAGLRIVRILEAATTSLTRQGAPVEI